MIMSKRKHAVKHKITAGRVISIIIITVLAVLALLSSSAAIIMHNMQAKMNANKIEYVPQTASNKKTNDNNREQSPVDVNAGKPLDVLIIGQDTRGGDGKNAEIGGSDEADRDNHQSDTTIIMHVSADRSRVSMVSLPRDSIINAPSCNTGSNIIPSRNAVMLNSVFPDAYNTSDDAGVAASCLVNTVNSLTGLDIQQFVLVDFAGMSDMIDALGGVDVCIPQDLQDDYTGLDLKRGMRHLNGVTATQYARVRHGLNTDGSDITRTTRQQHLLKALFDKLKSSSTLSNPAKLYNLANAALDNVSMSAGLANIGTLAGFAYSLRGISMNSIEAMTVPTEPYVYDANRVQWSDSAQDIWNALQADRSIMPQNTNKGGSDAVSSGTGTGNQNSQENPPESDSNDSNTASNDNTVNNDKVNTDTGLITEPDGRLIDPATGGIVNPDSGMITDADTGSVIGFADKYAEYAFCKKE